MRQVLVCLLLLAGALGMRAQEDPEYKMEIGGSVGLVNYLGDYNGNLTKDLQPMGSVVAKFRVNPRMSWAVSIGYGTLKGDIADAQTWFPEAGSLPPSFSNGLIDGSVLFEYNFWPFGTGREYRGARPLTPFFAFGLGLCHVNTPDNGVLAMSLPLGFGIKYKVRDRLNLTAEWLMHFTGSDRLDGVTDPYGIKSSGLFKNTDCFGTLQLSLTYDIWEKCKTCNNDRD
jgi:hypothetical protein